MEKRYNQWAGNPKGDAYDAAYCCAEVYTGGFGGHQCCRKSGHGPGGRYCKQHAKIREKRDNRPRYIGSAYTVVSEEEEGD